MKNTVSALRLARGLTQTALADELQVSRQTINAIENGRYDPSLPLALRIGRFFDQPLEAIFHLT
jgi:putative transcriptional regulator